MPNTETASWVFYIEEEGIYVCNNCRAHATSPEEIKHFATCQPGETKKWEKIYDEAAYLEAEKTEEAWWEKHYNTILD